MILASDKTNNSSADSKHINDSAADFKRSTSRGVIPKAKIKTVKMTLVIVFGEYNIILVLFVLKIHL